MGWRFYRRIAILPNLWVNLSKGGASVSVGVRGLRATFGRKRKQLTVGLPGTGLFFTHVEHAKKIEPVAPQSDGRRMLERALRQRRAGD